MVMSPLTLPAAGMSGSRSTSDSVSTLSSPCAKADCGANANMAAPAPSIPSASRRDRARCSGPALIDLLICGLRARRRELFFSSQRQAADQHIKRHRDNESGKQGVERAAPPREQPRRSGTDQSAGYSAYNEQP